MQFLLQVLITPERSQKVSEPTTWLIWYNSLMAAEIMAINSKAYSKLSPEAMSCLRVEPHLSPYPPCLEPGWTLSNCLGMKEVNE